jgi:hypothetical protein
MQFMVASAPAAGRARASHPVKYLLCSTRPLTLRVADPGGECAYQVSTSVSAEKAAYKEAIRDQVTAATPLPAGGVVLQLAFVVGPGRAWANLRKPTIDALGAVLGRDTAHRSGTSAMAGLPSSGCTARSTQTTVMM